MASHHRRSNSAQAERAQRDYLALRQEIAEAEDRLSRAQTGEVNLGRLRQHYAAVDRLISAGIDAIGAAIREGVSAPAGLGSWAAERARLGEARDRHWFAAADTSGVQIVAAVRVGSRAAYGPHIAGMVAEPARLVAETMDQPRIGVDLTD
jgi:hypothetical protein